MQLHACLIITTTSKMLCGLWTMLVLYALPPQLSPFTALCLEISCEMIKWLTSSSDQYDRWLARLAIREMSKTPLPNSQSVSRVSPAAACRTGGSYSCML